MSDPNFVGHYASHQDFVNAIEAAKANNAEE